MNKVCCPVCGGSLIYHRIDDGEAKVIIRAEDDYEVIAEDSDGSTRVYCAEDESHKIDSDTWDKVVLIAEAIGY